MIHSTFVLLLFALVSASASLTEAKDPALYELPDGIVVDGEVSDWDTVPPFAIEWPSAVAPTRTTTRKAVAQSDSADPPSALARLAYDAHSLFVVLEVHDDTLAFPERSWRFGDGFYLTVLAPGTGSRSDAHISLGFSRVGDRLEKVVVNRSGEYFPSVGMRGVALAMRPSPDELTAPDGSPVAREGWIAYEASIPWKLLFPAQPLLIDSLAINIVLVDRDGDEGRRIAMLEFDPDYDTERNPLRRGRMLPLVRHQHHDESVEFSAALSSRFASIESGIHASFALRGAPRGKHAVRFEAWQEGQLIGRGRHVVLTPNDPGLHRGTVRIGLDEHARTGPVVLRVSLESLRSAVSTHDAQDTLFLFVGQEIDRLAASLAHLEGAATARNRMAAPGALIRLQWLEAFRRSAPPNAPIDRPTRWWEEARAQAECLMRNDTEYLHAPKLQRLAHRSRIDGTLQAYSVWLPEVVPGKSYPTLVALHGSGVDESGTISTVGPLAAARGWIVVAPRGRGLSDWYVGAAEEDVLECLEHAASLFPIDSSRVCLAGFSMGGYGTWRIALRHGELFRAAAVLAGAAMPPEQSGGEAIGSLIRHRASRNDHPGTIPPILILHGTRDQAVPIEQARGMVQQLLVVGWRHEYREFEGVGHGRPEWWDVALEWLESM